MSGKRWRGCSIRAKSKSYCSGDNPAEWEGNLKGLLPRPPREEKHFPAMPWRELPEFMRRLRQQESPVARALEFLILTCTRSNEVLGARRDEIDLEARLWTIPAHRMKKFKTHVVPLSDPAVELLRGLPRRGDLIFPDPRDPNRPQWHSIMYRYLQLGFQPLNSRKARAVVYPYSLHGMRSSFRIWVQESERFRFEPDVVEQCMSHQVGSKVERAYAHSTVLDKRRKIMDAWADYLAGVSSEKIVSMPIRR
jgi:integrase